MSAIEKLASSLGRKDEEPNIALANQIAASGDSKAVRELVDGLSDKNPDVASDCIKVLHEVGAIKPTLVQDYVAQFVALLGSKNNRLVWGGMTALGSIAALRADEIGKHLDTVMTATQKGSVITQDWGVRVLAAVAGKNPTHAAKVVPFLRLFLQACPPKDLPRHADSVLPALNAGNKQSFFELLEERQGVLSEAQARRLGKTIKVIKAL